MWDPRENALGFTKEEDKLYLEAKDWHEQQKIVQMRDERRQRERAEQMRQQWAKSEEGRMFQQLSESFDACKRLLRDHPEAEESAAQLDGKNYDVYEKLRQNLEQAKPGSALLLCEIQRRALPGAEGEGPAALLHAPGDDGNEGERI